MKAEQGPMIGELKCPACHLCIAFGQSRCLNCGTQLEYEPRLYRHCGHTYWEYPDGTYKEVKPNE